MKATDTQATTTTSAIDETTAKSTETSTPARKVQKRKSPNTNTTITRRATRSMTTDAARQAVLQTDELLDAILINLSMQQLFVIQRVSKRFKAVIAATPAIQEKMFLRLKGGPIETWTVDQDTYRSSGTNHGVVAARSRRRPATLNPALYNDSGWGIQQEDWLSDRSVSLDCRPFLAKQSISLREDTFISDPPCFKAEASFRNEDQRVRRSGMVEIHLLD